MRTAMKLSAYFLAKIYRPEASRNECGKCKKTTEYEHNIQQNIFHTEGE